MTAAGPFVKWLGGKRQLMSLILPLVPEKIGTYYEPFVGGGALFFALHNSKGFIGGAVLNDYNSDLMDAYRTIQQNVDLLIELLKTYPVEKDFFDALRLQPGLTELEKAARLLYLTRTSFNGLWRVNSKGQFNAPWGKYTNPRIVDESNLNAVNKALQGVTLTCQDFEASVRGAKKGDFVYFDPPYVPLNPTSSFTAYTSGGFGIHAHERLARTFFDLQSDGVSVLLSNSDTPFVRSLYQGATITPVMARRNVNSKGSLRGPVGEVLISSSTVARTTGLSAAAASLDALYRGQPWYLGVGQGDKKVVIYVKKRAPALKALEDNGWMTYPIEVGVMGSEGIVAGGLG